MKTGLKYTLITIGILFGIIITSILLDTLNAYIFKKSPIISKYEILEDYNYVDRGVLFDVYHCHYSADVVYVDWVFKLFNKTCPPIKDKYMISVVDHVFIKTYMIETIEKIDENYQYLTVSQYDGERREKVKASVLLQEIEEGKKYEILFKVKSNNIEENIISIFENSTILSINETDKDVNQFIR